MGTERRQFRVLHREFIFRLVDRELLSPQATGDVSQLLTQVASLLICISALSLIPAMSFAAAMPPLARQIYGWSIVHFFIAVTMLAVGLFAVWCWEAMYPDRRDVLVLAPLPVRARTVFLAKIAGNLTALLLTVGSLNLIAGLAWPLTLNKAEPSFRSPVLTSDAALPPIGAADLQARLDRDFAAARAAGGRLAPGADGGLAIGVSIRGERRIFTYGAASADSLFELGSITKPMTGLVLARLIARGETSLDEPVRALLTPVLSLAPAASGLEIRLRDLVTHHAGLPTAPTNFIPPGPRRPMEELVARYDETLLHAYLSARGLHRQGDPPFRYSNLGFGLLGHALAVRAGRSYPDLLRDLVTAPLGMTDTAIALTADQRRRFLQGHDEARRPVPEYNMNALASAGGVRSTAGDMLAWLEANMHPERLADRALAAAIVASHQPQASTQGSGRIALAWLVDPRTGTIDHGGATSGFTAHASFNRRTDTAVIVLSNARVGSAISADFISRHIRARLAGMPAVTIDEGETPARGGVVSLVRLFLAWWITMLSAGLFVFSAVMGLQGLAAWMLPRRVFLRVSTWLQMGTFTLIVVGFCLQSFVIQPTRVVDAQEQAIAGILVTSPTLWFLGLFQAIAGSPLLAPLAGSAWRALAITVASMTIAYGLSYFHVFRRMAEAPDIAPTARRARWLRWWPAIGSGPSTAVARFTVRTLLRSSPHRVILAFYWGLGLALALLVLKTPAAEALSQPTAAESHWIDASEPLMAVSLLIMTLAVLGARVAFALPRELRANWIFRILPLPSGTALLALRRRALAIASVGPVLIAAAALCFTIWPWRMAAGHLIALACSGAILVELCLPGAQKIPFTCSYLPGKSVLHLTFWIGLALYVPLTLRLATVEQEALQDPVRFAQMIGLLLLFLFVARLRTTWLARNATSPEPVFDEEAAGTATALNVWDSPRGRSFAPLTISEAAEDCTGSAPRRWPPSSSGSRPA